MSFAGVMKDTEEEFETDNGEYDDSEKNEKTNLEQWCHGFQYGLEHDLET